MYSKHTYYEQRPRDIQDTFLKIQKVRKKDSATILRYFFLTFITNLIVFRNVNVWNWTVSIFTW